MLKQFIFLLVGLVPTFALAQSIEVPIHRLTDDQTKQGIGEHVGTLRLEDGDFGLLITPNLKQVAPGFHGFHIHMNPSCEGELKEGEFVLGLGAGGHYDPHSSHNHAGPFAKDGHVGDLPPLYCDIYGSCNQSSLAPKLTVKEVMGRSIMIHQHGDNFSDTPMPLGGGGSRIACGVIQGSPKS
jgi:superoxide dismutase, Cu-Zn family